MMKLFIYHGRVRQKDRERLSWYVVREKSKKKADEMIESLGVMDAKYYRNLSLTGGTYIRLGMDGVNNTPRPTWFHRH